jgi:hypothetical protein
MTRSTKKPGSPKTIRETLQSAAQGNAAPAETVEAPLTAPREIDGIRAKTLAAAMRILAEKGVEN